MLANEEIKRLNECFLRSKWISMLKNSEIRYWKESFKKYLGNVSKTSYDYIHRWDTLEGFANSNINLIKKNTYHFYDKFLPILVCVVRDEVERIETFFEHYRGIGIRHFVIIDNASVDETLSLLKKQVDADIWSTNDKFDARTKVGWVNRMIATYGMDHWYLMVDADELLSWIDMEYLSLKDMVNLFDQSKINRCRAIMLDMYPKKNTGIGSFQDNIAEFKYFDANSYYHVEREEVYLICGGPRKRVLDLENWLTKYPLFKLGADELISNPHTIFPYNNQHTPCYFALLHYKFVSEQDMMKLNKAVKEGNYVGGSAEYKQYQKKMQEGGLNFWTNDSLKYINSKSLNAVNEIDFLDKDVGF